MSTNVSFGLRAGATEMLDPDEAEAEETMELEASEAAFIDIREERLSTPRAEET
jgi:hypothetical protein